MNPHFLSYLLFRNQTIKPVLADDLLQTARTLVSSGKNRPKQSDLRRSVSTAYYAMFHTLTRCCADLLVGTKKARRSSEAWYQVYRSLDHNGTRKACKNSKLTKFPTAIQDFADTFVSMQEKRHKADYDPNEKFFKSAVLNDIILVETNIKKFRGVQPKDRCAFAVFILLKERNQ